MNYRMNLAARYGALLLTTMPTLFGCEHNLAGDCPPEAQSCVFGGNGCVAGETEGGCPEFDAGLVPEGMRTLTIPFTDGPKPLEMDIYRPATSTEGQLPVLMWVHDGGWSGGSRSPVPGFLLRQVERGYAVAAIDYTLAVAGTTTLDQPVKDIHRAIRYLKAHGSEHGLDGDRIILVGASAGGHLASLAVVTSGVESFEPIIESGDPLSSTDSRVIGILVIAGPTNLNAYAHSLPDSDAGEALAKLLHTYLGCPELDTMYPTYRSALTENPTCMGLQTDASVNTWIKGACPRLNGLPPAYLVYGMNDFIVPKSQGEHLNEAWSQYGDTAHEFVDGCGHCLIRTGPTNIRAADSALDGIANAGVTDGRICPDTD